MKKLTVAVALLFACASAFAQSPATPPKREAGFKAGELAPPLQVAEWVKGAPIAQLEKGKVYLVEFWAVWCGPCIGNIPHLNAMQKKYGKDGLVVIGFSNPDVAAGETTARKEGNTLEQVRAFVAGRGARMDYHVAYDTPDKATYKSWMNTMGGIPHAFLIDREGRLAVNFHPYYMDDAIQQVLAGTWDNVEGYKKLRRSSELYGETLRTKTYDEFRATYGKMESEFPFLAHRMLDVKFDRVRLARDEKEFVPTASAMLAAAREEGNGAAVAAIVRSQLRPRPAARPPTDSANASAEVRQRNAEAAAKAAQREEDEKTALKLPLELLAQMADTACAVSKDADPVALSAKAEVAFARGDRPAAIELQTKAAALASGTAKTTEEKRLADFKSAPGS